MNCNNKFSPIPETYPQGCGKLEMSPVENYIIPVENLLGLQNIIEGLVVLERSCYNELA